VVSALLVQSPVAIHSVDADHEIKDGIFMEITNRIRKYTLATTGKIQAVKLPS